MAIAEIPLRGRSLLFWQVASIKPAFISITYVNKYCDPGLKEGETEAWRIWDLSIADKTLAVTGK